VSVRVCESAVCKYAFLVGFAFLPPGWDGRPSLRRLVVSVPCVFKLFFSPQLSMSLTRPRFYICKGNIEEKDEREWLRMHWFHLEELKTGMCTQISIHREEKYGKRMETQTGVCLVVTDTE